MIAFAALLERLAFTTDPDARVALVRQYCAARPDPERGEALGVLTGALRLPQMRPGFLRAAAAERCDPVLFQWSHEFVGDLTETVALMWPAERRNAPAPALSDLLHTPRSELPGLLPGWLDACDPGVRLVLLKLLTGGSRAIMTGATVRAALAALGGVPVAAVDEVWHGQAPPYIALFAWLEGRGPRPAPGGFHPFMLAGDTGGGDWIAEPLWEGDRVQVSDGRVFSRHAEDVSATYPAWCLTGVVLDGVVTADPLCLRLFDMLFEGPEDLRPLGFRVRRARLEAWFERERPPGMALSDLVPFAGAGTGLMLKHPDSPYVAARGHGFWVKRRRPPRLVSAQLLYAEEGRYTVGLWHAGVLVPIGQATALDADSLDRWVREHTIARYGPVREVDKTLVVSVAFTSVRPAPRRKAGVVLRGARIVGLLGDARADRLDALVARD